MEATIGALLKSRAENLGAKVYAIDHNGAVSYSELLTRSNNIAKKLRMHGIEFGDRVVVALPNSVKPIEVYCALALIGAVAVPVNPRLTVREISLIAKDSAAKGLIGHDEVVKRLVPERGELPYLEVVVCDESSSNADIAYEDLRVGSGRQVDDHDVASDDVAAILYTSGTTGVPKGAMLTHKGLISNAYAVVDRVKFGEQDRSVCVLPLYHLFAIAFDFLQMMVAGASTSILSNFDPEHVCDVVDTQECSVLVGVPTMYTYLCKFAEEHGRILRTLRIGDTGGAPVSTELKKRVAAQFGMTLLESYGLTEASPVVTIEDPVGLRKVGSCGRVVRGAEIRVVGKAGEQLADNQVGEVCVRGPLVMKGYFNLPEATASTVIDDWLHTGDLGRQDAEGFLYIVDRLKDMVISGGFNIYPKEIESVLNEHPEIVESAVVGVPDEKRGEIPKAFVVAKKGGSVNEGELDEYCRKYLVAYKVPRCWEIVDHLPKTGTGKVDKPQLRGLR